jgi:hypothetical protein
MVIITASLTYIFGKQAIDCERKRMDTSRTVHLLGGVTMTIPGEPVKRSPVGRVKDRLFGWANSGRMVALALFGNPVFCGLLYSVTQRIGPIKGQWWAIVTASTVGYGDIYPVTTTGRGIAAFLITTEVLLLALGTAHLTRVVLVDANAWEDWEQRMLLDNVAQILLLVRNIRKAAVTIQRQLIGLVDIRQRLQLIQAQNTQILRQQALIMQHFQIVEPYSDVPASDQ